MTQTRSRLSPHLSLSLPPRWRRRSDLDHGVLVHASATTVPPSGVRPELVVRCEPTDDDLVAWRREAVTALAGRLDDFELEDAEEIDLDGRPVAYRRFAHRSPLADLISEQWSWLHGGLGTTLTGTVAREDYPDWCEVFEAIAETVEVS